MSVTTDEFYSKMLKAFESTGEDFDPNYDDDSKDQGEIDLNRVRGARDTFAEATNPSAKPMSANFNDDQIEDPNFTVGDIQDAKYSSGINFDKKNIEDRNFTQEAETADGKVISDNFKEDTSLDDNFSDLDGRTNQPGMTPTVDNKEIDDNEFNKGEINITNAKERFSLGNEFDFSSDDYKCAEIGCGFQTATPEEFQDHQMAHVSFTEEVKHGQVANMAEITTLTQEAYGEDKMPNVNLEYEAGPKQEAVTNVNEWDGNMGTGNTGKNLAGEHRRKRKVKATESVYDNMGSDPLHAVGFKCNCGSMITEANYNKHMKDVHGEKYAQLGEVKLPTVDIIPTPDDDVKVGQDPDYNHDLNDHRVIAHQGELGTIREVDHPTEAHEADIDLSRTEVFDYLFELQDSGETNMMGAGPYLQREFGMDSNEARDYATHWMSNWESLAKERGIEARVRATEVEQEEVSQYLDELRESGDTNMFGAGPYVEAEFGIDKREAKKFVMYWMQNFGKESRVRVGEVEQDEVSTFLDSLRESGATNMFGAGQYIEEAFGVSRSEARTFLSYWMKNFKRASEMVDEDENAYDLLLAEDKVLLDTIYSDNSDQSLLDSLNNLGSTTGDIGDESPPFKDTKLAKLGESLTCANCGKTIVQSDTPDHLGICADCGQGGYDTPEMKAATARIDAERADKDHPFNKGMRGEAKPNELTREELLHSGYDEEDTPNREDAAPWQKGLETNATEDKDWDNRYGDMSLEEREKLERDWERKTGDAMDAYGPEPDDGYIDGSDVPTSGHYESYAKEIDGDYIYDGQVIGRVTDLKPEEWFGKVELSNMPGMAEYGTLDPSAQVRGDDGQTYSDPQGGGGTLLDNPVFTDPDYAPETGIPNTDYTIEDTNFLNQERVSDNALPTKEEQGVEALGNEPISTEQPAEVQGMGMGIEQPQPEEQVQNYVGDQIGSASINKCMGCGGLGEVIDEQSGGTTKCPACGGSGHFLIGEAYMDTVGGNQGLAKEMDMPLDNPQEEQEMEHLDQFSQVGPTKEVDPLATIEAAINQNNPSVTPATESFTRNYAAEQDNPNLTQANVLDINQAQGANEMFKMARDEFSALRK